MGEKNSHGLDRYVPQDVRREIRSRCGFGCVICGLAYYDYEHFDPDFKDAKRHNPKGMTLLCMQCNHKRARGTLSAQTVAKANENPKCKQLGFASELFDFGSDPIKVKLGGATFNDCKVLVRIDGVDILSFRPPEEPGSPMLLSGHFTDAAGATTLKIVDNVWSVANENWDVEVVGSRITIRRGLGDIALQIRVMPPFALAVEKIDLVFGGWYLRGGEDSLAVSENGWGWNTLYLGSINGCNVGMRFE